MYRSHFIRFSREITFKKKQKILNIINSTDNLFNECALQRYENEKTIYFFMLTRVYDRWCWWGIIPNIVYPLNSL